MSISPDDPRLAGLSPEDLATIPQSTPSVDRALQPFIDDPYLAKNRFKYGTIDGTIGGPMISGLPNPNIPPVVTPSAVIAPVETVEERIARLDRESAERIAASDQASRAFKPGKDARNTIKAVLATYGLESLSDFLYNVYAKQEVDINNSDALIFAIRGQEAYKTRFAANATRAQKGLSELDPGSYVELENTFRRLMQSNGLPTGFYDQTSDFTKLIEGDVSPAELQDRVQNGFRAVQDADPEVKRQMQELYGVSEGGLAAYFLDPQKAAPILTRQAQAAQVSARAREQGGFQLGSATAEDLVARGYTPDEAQKFFTQAGLLAGLYQEMAGEQALTQAEKVGVAFGYDVASTQVVERRKKERINPFKQGGAFTKTTGATSGSVETGLGVAQ